MVGGAIAAALVLGGLLVAATIPHPSGAGAKRHAPGAREVSAESLEHAVIDQITRPRPAAAEGGGGGYRSEAWSVSIMEADVNAWLETRLGAWAASRGVSLGELGGTRVRFDEGAAYVFVPWRGVWGLTVVLTLDAPAAEGVPVKVGVRGVRLGLLPVPRRMPAPMLGGATSQAWARELAEAGTLTLSKREVGLEDGRRVRLVSAALRAGRLEVTCVTEKRGG